MTSAALMRRRECVERSKVEAGTACYHQGSEADAEWPQSCISFDLTRLVSKSILTACKLVKKLPKFSVDLLPQQKVSV